MTLGGLVVVDRIGPNRSGFWRDRDAPNKRFRIAHRNIGLVEFVPATPTAQLRMFGTIEAIEYQGQPRGRVALHAPGNVRVYRSERSVTLLNVRSNPGVADRLIVDSGNYCIDTGPRRGRVVAAGAGDVK